MRNLTVMVALLILVAVPAFGQFEAGASYAGPAIGLSFLGSSVQFGANYEYGMAVDFGTIGIGGIFRYWSYSESFFGGSWKYSDVLIGAQGNYHFKLENTVWDPWAGLVLAYDAGSVSYDGPGTTFATPTYGGLFLGGHAGVRYFFSPTMAATARFGFGTLGYSSLDLGVDFKF